MGLAFYSSKDGGGMANIETEEIPLTEEELKEFGRALYQWRLTNRITIREFSKQLGIKPSLLSQIETGANRVKITTFEKL